ncbi:MAG: hypothetical protein EOP50_09395, partial [Sphingobacteriales bacterium]
MKRSLFALVLTFNLVSNSFAATDATVNATCAKAEGSEQREKYCSASQDAHSAENASKGSSYIWYAVAAVCGVATFTPGGTALCSNVNTGGSASDSLLKKDYQGALTTAGSSDLTKALQSKGADAATQKAADKAADKGGVSSAIIAVQAALKAGSSQQNATTAGDVVDQLGKTNDAITTVGTTTVKVPTMSQNQSAVISGGGKTTSVSNTNPQLNNGRSTLCSDGSVQSLSGAYQCAKSKGAELPAPETVAAINQQLKNLTGKDINDYLKSGSAASMVNDALGKIKDPEKAKEMKDAISTAFTSGVTQAGETQKMAKGSGSLAGSSIPLDDDINLKGLIQDLVAAQGGKLPGEEGGEVS